MTDIAQRETSLFPDWVSRRDWLPHFDWMPRIFDFDWETPALRLEEYKEDGNLMLKAEMPGIDPDKDVNISVTDGRLIIEAERKQESKTQGKEGYRSEFRYGSFVRNIPLPTGVKQSDIKASYRDGVLTVQVRIPEEAKKVTSIPVSHD